MFFNKVILFIAFFCYSCDFTIPEDNELFDFGAGGKLFTIDDYEIEVYKFREGQTSGLRTLVDNSKLRLVGGFLEFEVFPNSAAEYHVEYSIEILLKRSVYTRSLTKFVSNYKFSIENSNPSFNKYLKEFEQQGDFYIKENNETEFFKLALFTDLSSWLEANKYYDFKWTFRAASGKNNIQYQENSAKYRIDLNIYGSN
jgi:hypothetical protein